MSRVLHTTDVASVAYHPRYECCALQYSPQTHSYDHTSSSPSATLPWSCSFDSSVLCNMVQSTDDVFDYTRLQGETDTSSTGPTSGRTGTASDFYIYAEVGPQEPGDDAK